MCTYFWVLICIFISTSLFTFKDLNILVCSALGVQNWAGFEVQGIPSSSPQYTIQVLMFFGI